ncbi:MAG: site-specific DNA-methyltransferase [Gammaproteobacteria bacterium]|nr:site-specific DNA-methyltransferase [Gammaproteobacteria bacterium]MYG11296.1 site-specific DNA-methyltransferase [Gammaproteobacteria bacterium]MYK28040.1 site-specific DNA-methyltransferase [Gammaproteobacteria bacterium]
MNRLTCKIKNYIQPFERRLALDELRALAPGTVHPTDGDEATASTFSLTGAVNVGALRDALAYWRSVGPEPEGLTKQVRGEATVAVARNGMALGDLGNGAGRRTLLKPPRKRCLRYATHGLHEYRGKFFPQLVRALINAASVPEDGIVIDPMCGSGTTLVEARLAGRCAYGLDINPLSVFVANVKCLSLSLSPKSLAAACESLHRSLDGIVARGQRCYFDSLPERDQDYLCRWFAPRVLDELDCVQQAIGNLRTSALRDYYAVALSNILRGVSWQKDDDLRVRRQMNELPGGAVIERFLKEALRSTKVVGAFIAERGRAGLGTYVMQEGDARIAADTMPQLTGRADAIITSPPYATALPYIDTDRLSLAYLGLLPRGDHRSRDLLMIGNREVTERCRLAYWTFYQTNRALLPKGTGALIDRIHELNSTHEVGFRRRNLPALLSKYFFDMREVLGQMFILLRPGGIAFMVIGDNRTTAGGELVKINTADHLTAIAESVGFRKVDDVPMEMLSSRDIYRKNAMPSERIVALRRL